MTQAITQEQTESLTQPVRFTISVERVAYVVLAVLALLLRLAELDTIPFTDAEAAQALAAWRVTHPGAAGEAFTASSPLLFWGQDIAFATVGGSEIAARLFTSLGGVLLALSPALFRARLGHARAFLLSLLLALSPVALVASRFNAPVVWTMLFALLGLWALWRYYDHQRHTDALITAVAFAAMIFLSGPGGPVLAVILVLAAVAAVARSVISAPEKLDVPGSDLLNDVRERFRPWPWGQALLAAGLVTFIVSTGSMLYPAGLSMVGQLLETSIQGITEAKSGAPAAFPLLTALFYEPFLWLFAAIAIWVLVRRRTITFVERFLVGWVVAAVIISLLYRGAGPEHALWLVVPLAGLASSVLAQLVVNGRAPLLFWMEENEAFWSRVWWVRWVLAVATLALLLIGTIHLEVVGRSLLTLPVNAEFGEALNLLMDASYVNLRYSLIWVVITAVFLVVGFFLAASLWGNTIAVQGGGLGLLAFMFITGFGSGWNAAVNNAHNPVELWHVQPTARHVIYLRETLHELTQRESAGFPLMPLTVLVDSDVITGRSVLAWELREFENTDFVATLEQARGDQIVILPATLEVPDLGGSYVGQDFVLSHIWDLNNLSLVEIPAWWLQRRVRSEPEVAERVILWLRQDVYDGVPSSERP